MKCRDALEWEDLLFMPFIRPFRWRILPFIYLVPLIPLYILWDGIASILRTYSAE